MERETCFAFSDETIEILRLLAIDGIPALGQQAGPSWWMIALVTLLAILVTLLGVRTAFYIWRDYY